MPAITRIGDLDCVHCSQPARSVGSGNVYANGIAVSRVGDPNTVHLKPGGSDCVPHVASISEGSLTVFINGMACGRIGDPIAGCTAVAQGSGSVFVG